MSKSALPIVSTIICFHEADEPFLQVIESHLTPLCRENLLTIWHTAKSIPGEDRERLFLERLSRASLILLLVSADFNADWDKRLSEAIQSSNVDSVKVVPVVLRPCVWSGLPYFGLQPLPKDGKPLIVNGVPNEARLVKFANEVRDLAINIQRTPLGDIPASTIANSALFATIALIERERFSLETALESQFLEADTTRTGNPPSDPQDQYPIDSLRSTHLLLSEALARFRISAEDPEVVHQIDLKDAASEPVQSAQVPAEVGRPTIPRAMQILRRAIEASHKASTAQHSVLFDALCQCCIQFAIARDLASSGIPPQTESTLSNNVIDEIFRDFHKSSTPSRYADWQSLSPQLHIGISRLLALTYRLVIYHYLSNVLQQDETEDLARLRQKAVVAHSELLKITLPLLG